MGDSMAAEKQKSDPDDTKKSKKDKWMNFFSLSNPDLWIALGVIALVIILGWYFGNQIFNTIIAGKDFFREAQILKKYPSFATSYSESEPGTDWENLPTRDQELPWSLVVYYIVFVACAMVFIPYGPFCIAMGFIFGVYWGFLIQMGAIFVSSATLFIIGRYLFKDYAAKINLLLCFMPVPYGSHPYLFSLTAVPFEQFVFFFMLGMIPNTILNLLIGSALAEAAEADGINIYHLIGTGLAILGILVAVWYASSIAQEVLEEADAADEEAPATEGSKLLS